TSITLPPNRPDGRNRRRGSPERVSLYQPSRFPLELAVPPDEIVGRTIMGELGFFLALELGDDALGRSLAKLDSPLTEGVDVPDSALCEPAELIERTQFSQRRRGQSLHKNGVGWPVALKTPVRDKPIGRAFGLDLLGRFSKGERLGLRKDVREQH